jgi:hypothetical protein
MPRNVSGITIQLSSSATAMRSNTPWRRRPRALRDRLQSRLGAAGKLINGPRAHQRLEIPPISRIRSPGCRGVARLDQSALPHGPWGHMGHTFPLSTFTRARAHANVLFAKMCPMCPLRLFEVLGLLATTVERRTYSATDS